jgi:hypothetical protein
MSSNKSSHKRALPPSFDQTLSLLCYSPEILDVSLAQSIFLFRTRSPSFPLYMSAKRHVHTAIATDNYAFLYIFLKNHFPAWSQEIYEELREENTRTEIDLDLFFDEFHIKDNRDPVHHILISKFLLMVKFLDKVLPSFLS